MLHIQTWHLTSKRLLLEFCTFPTVLHENRRWNYCHFVSTCMLPQHEVMSLTWSDHGSCLFWLSPYPLPKYPAENPVASWQWWQQARTGAKVQFQPLTVQQTIETPFVKATWTYTECSVHTVYQTLVTSTNWMSHLFLPTTPKYIEPYTCTLFTLAHQNYLRCSEWNHSTTEQFSLPF